MAQKLNNLAIGYSAAIVSALFMLLTGIAGNLGIYSGFVNVMTQMHAFFSLSVLGIIAGIIEAAFWGFVIGWLFAWTYNKFA